MGRPSAPRWPTVESFREPIPPPPLAPTGFRLPNCTVQGAAELGQTSRRPRQTVLGWAAGFPNRTEFAGAKSGMNAIR